MITYYTMIAETEMLSLKSHFYRVAIGSIPSAHMALFVLSRYCSEQHFYFQKRTLADDRFRLKIAESLGVKVYKLPCMDAKVECLVDFLKKNGSLPWQPADAGNLRHLKAHSSPSFYLLCNTECLKRGTF